MSVFATEGLLDGPDTVQRGVRGQRGAGVASRSSVGAALAQSWVMLETEYLTVTRAAYDTIASDYARVLDGALTRMSWDRAVLCTFAELVARDRLGPVADVGCGTGRITGYLHHLGLDVVGIDLSPGMLAVARQALPGLCFVEGSMTALDLPDASFGGVVAWYSLIHIAPLDVPAVLTELGRVLVPGAQLLLAFQVGDQRRHLEQAYGHAISLDAYRMQPDQLAQQLDAVGMAVYARVVRDPEDPETEPQAYLLARKSAAAPPESAAVSAGNTSWGSAYRNDRAGTAAQSELRLPGEGNARRGVSTGRVLSGTSFGASGYGRRRARSDLHSPHVGQDL